MMTMNYNNIVLILLSSLLSLAYYNTSNAFSFSSSSVSRRNLLSSSTTKSSSCLSSTTSSSSSIESNDDDENNNNNIANIEEWLSSIMVYTVIDVKNEGIVLLREEDNPNEIANFFFTPEAANEMYKPVKEEVNDTNLEWDITQLSLGDIWFDLFAEEQEGIEYRLVPDTKELLRARKLMTQQQNAMKDNNDNSTLVFRPYNQIPIFFDERLSVNTDETTTKVPFFLSLQTCLATCQKAMKMLDEYNQPEIIVTELISLINQMTDTESNNTTNYLRDTILVPILLTDDNNDEVENNNNKEESTTQPTTPPKKDANYYDDLLQLLNVIPTPTEKKENDNNPKRIMSTDDDLWE